MSFASDNWAGASDAVVAALAAAADGFAPAYGGDPLTHEAHALAAAFFEREVALFFVSTGSAANSLSLAAASRPGGVVICHVDAHIARDEAGAPGLFAPHQTLDPIDGAAGRLTADAVAARLAEYPEGVVHHGRPTAISLTNVNEFGQCYGGGEVAAIADVAHARGAMVHLDGARFFNALAHTGAAPADLTWRAGVDIMSLGFTKVGAFCAEAVVLFDPAMAEDFAYRHKQAAMLFSKNRFAAAQAVALLKDGHALALAAHANAMATRLAALLEASPEAALLFAPEANEMFAYLAPALSARLAAAGIVAHAIGVRSRLLPPAPGPDWTLQRFVTSFRTDAAQLDALAAALSE
ncbi:threonine aldolase family protein [Acuticoccus mangrovi]|uniref:Low specificity L-threonine aldolase n=1 Tax=Acuticoccus mangrovi TaxID=2796142 RepID=A0A934MFF9_9HYPH|nr:beta-eliminating lyase-related protein [Acuticoccus mangrovi]MBJ3775423.1 low specificity L-threonine aldolase [Acuticoccus mangrovi]